MALLTAPLSLVPLTNSSIHTPALTSEQITLTSGIKKVDLNMMEYNLLNLLCQTTKMTSDCPNYGLAVQSTVLLTPTLPTMLPPLPKPSYNPAQHVNLATIEQHICHNFDNNHCCILSSAQPDTTGTAMTLDPFPDDTAPNPNTPVNNLQQNWLIKPSQDMFQKAQALAHPLLGTCALPYLLQQAPFSPLSPTNALWANHGMSGTSLSQALPACPSPVMPYPCPLWPSQTHILPWPSKTLYSVGLLWPWHQVITL